MFGTMGISELLIILAIISKRKFTTPRLRSRHSLNKKHPLRGLSTLSRSLLRRFRLLGRRTPQPQP
jgi:hypothetical protein